MSVLLVIANNNGGLNELYVSMRQNASEFRDQNPAGDPVHSFSRIDMLSTFARLAGDAGPGWIVPAGMVFVLLTGGGLWHRISNAGQSWIGETNSGIPCVAILLCIYHQPHDMLLLVPFMVCLWNDVKKPDRQPVDALVFGLLATVFANFAATATILNRIGGTSSPLWVPATSINGLILLVVFAILCAKAAQMITHDRASAE